jgi:hypothetical protein
MVFLVIAFALFTLMIVVQQTVVLQFREWRLEAGVNLVQRGIDVTFDIVYCFGVISLGVVLYQMVGFGRGLAAAGIFAAGVLLAANLATFPHPPAESGLIDLGPVTAVWWVLVILRLIRVGTPMGRRFLCPGRVKSFILESGHDPNCSDSGMRRALSPGRMCPIGAADRRTGSPAVTRSHNLTHHTVPRSHDGGGVEPPAS